MHLFRPEATHGFPCLGMNIYAPVIAFHLYENNLGLIDA
jgi:hypothetical protein